MLRSSNSSDIKRISGEALTLTRKLGSGSFSTVYKAIYERENEQKAKEVALKVFKSDTDPEKEAHIHMAAQHACVVKMYGYVEADTYKGLVLELCKKGTLTDYLEETDLTLEMIRDQREQIALDIIKGLVFLHEQHIIHRDFKTDNILLKNHKINRNQTRFIAKITDFGLSTQLLPGETTYTTDRCQGTPGWLAPESCIPDEEKKAYVTTAKVDIFALGMVLNLLTRDDEHIPFSRIKDGLDLIRFMIHVKLQSLALPEAYRNPTTLTLIHQCWSDKPADRPDASQVLAHFESGNRLFKVTQS